MTNNKSSIDMLAKFLAFYDYSYWHYKLEALYTAIEGENFVKEIAKKFTRGGENVERIKDRLVSELVFTNLHMMETLFTLIGAFTFEPENP